MTQPTLVDYAVARFLRLFPALFVATIGIAFVLGPVVTSVSLGEYFTDPRPWLFVPLTASLITHSMALPGVFETVPESGVIDPPLWTLRYETMCYVLLALFALVGVLATRFRATLTLAVVFGIYAFITFATSWRGGSSAIDSATRFILDFFLGGAFYVFADKIKLDGCPRAGPGGGRDLRHDRLRIGVHGGADLRPPLVRNEAGPIRRFNLIGDYSYGIYIPAFPSNRPL